MRKNGFTLIELLAVIVILAIIALIATPIILGIINDAREKANERSVELYAAAVKNAMAAYQLTNPNAPKSFSDLTVQYDGDVKCTVQELYEDGSFYLEGCKVNNGTKEYSYGTKQIIKGKLGSVCKPAEEQLYATNALEAGYKYECKVDPNKEAYVFYVLTSVGEGATSINLIMDSNIRTGGEAVKEANPTDAQKGTVAWISKLDYEREDIGGTNWGDGNWDKGPITAIEYLQTATAGWTNANELTINTFDSYDYLGNYVNTHTMKEYIVNARMPYKGEVSSYGSNAYLFNNLIAYCYDDKGSETSCDASTNIDGVHEEGMTHVSEVDGYWTLASDASNSDIAWCVWYNGDTNVRDGVSNVGDYGVRPVINLSI